jgi:potassium efflux system protein
LITSVAFLWGCELIREFCRPDGVGQRLFDWPATATEAVRCKLEPVLIAGAPLITMLLLAEHGDVDSMQSLQRVLFITIMTLIGIQLAQLTRPSGALMRSLADCSETSWIVRGRYLIYLAAAGVPLAFVALSVSGYHFSAYQLSKHLGETGAALIGIIALHAVSLAWLKVLNHNRRLHDQAAREQAAREQAARDEATREESLGAGQANAPVSSPNEGRHCEADSEDQEQYLPTAAAPAQSHEEKVNQEVRDLLRYACLLLMGVGGWLIWSDVFPALRVFDNIVLWQSIESVAETVVDASGTEAIRVVDHYVPTTLTDLLLAGLICLATWMIGRRLPGMVELALFSKLPFEHGGRQAMGIIIGYLASAAGFILACNVIHLSWSSVQWLAAAMTVGLGFGLQEIFANLVSGLIILVERPIRVGDIVSVGDVTGTVSRMKMRATTVTDWDRRELIVPNKKFITDNVINWSLSDPISRIVLPVGVAYGTDINRVRRILLRIADECPHVLKDPAPNTLFKGFGDSTLNVQLMVFIPERRVYIDVVNELNCAIAREFARAKISIAFPQLDLHIDPKGLREALADARREDLHAA